MTDTPAADPQIGDYYNETLVDYQAWSREGYLHFGYWKPWLNPFVRKPMLEEMNRLVFSLLDLQNLSQGQIADLGCGVGAVARHGSRMFSNLQFHAVSISPGQIETGKSMQRDEHVQYYCTDYHQLPFESAQLDGIYFLESLCHSTQPDVALAEAARTLKKGGRIALTDGYLTRPLAKTSKFFQTIVKGVAHNWAVPMFHEIELGRKWTGNGQLKLIDEFECGWRLGPSALHAAHLSLFHFAKLIFQRKVTRWQWKHLKASAFTIMLGLYRPNFRYHVLTFEKV